MATKDTRNKEPPKEPRTGSVAPEDAALTTWLHALWHADEPPERLEVHQMFNPRHSVRGQMIHHVDFKANSKYDVEQANRLANEIMAVAQNDCDCAEQKSFYEIAIVDLNRRASPLVRRIGPMHPRTSYLVKPGEQGRGHEDEDTDELPGPRTQTERYNHLLSQRLDRREDGINRVLGDALLMYRDMAMELRNWNSSMAQNQMKFFTDLQDALDRSKERERAGAWQDLKVELARDGVREGRNILMGLVGQKPARPPELAESTVGKFAQAIKSQVEDVAERELIDGFLLGCEREGILPKLFGEWTNGGPVPGKPGIFTPQQCAILLKVHDGELPPEAIDEIIPEFGGKYEITLPQLVEAQPLIPKGVATALLQLKAVRESKRAAAQTTAATTPSPTATPA